MYIGYEEYEESIDVFTEEDVTKDLKINPASVQVETTKITAKKRQDKVRFAEEKPAEYAAERGPDIDYSDYEYAKGGIARMLGE